MTMAALLLRYATDGVVLLFDGDRAGQRCGGEARTASSLGRSCRCAPSLLPEGSDPADLCHGASGALECRRM